MQHLYLDISAALNTNLDISAALNTILFQQNLKMIISAGGGCTYASLLPQTSTTNSSNKEIAPKAPTTGAKKDPKPLPRDPVTGAREI